MQIPLPGSLMAVGVPGESALRGGRGEVAHLPPCSFYGSIIAPHTLPSPSLPCAPLHSFPPFPSASPPPSDHTALLPRRCVVLLDDNGRSVAPAGPRRCLLYRDPELRPRGVLAAWLVPPPPGLMAGWYAAAGGVRSALIMPVAVRGWRTGGGGERLVARHACVQRAVRSVWSWHVW